jgi:dTDP-4-amino-4,6-dideoxygalactose transaminase
MNVPYLDLKAQIKPIRTEIDQAIAEVIDTCSFCLGPRVAAFERSFAEFCGVKQAVALNSGTSALHIALKLLGIGPGDEVIAPAMTFVATAWAISYVGAKPVLVDIDPDTYTMSPEAVKKALSSRTRAVIPVHLYGHPADLDGLVEICGHANIPLVEDCAQSHGAIYKGRKAGSYGAISCYSFYPGKNLGAFGEGGALLTDNEDYAKRAKALREHASTTRYYHDEVGYNYRMEGIQGAVLGVKLKYLNDWTQQRRRVAHRYIEKLKGLPIKLPVESKEVQSVYHIFAIQTKTRDSLKKYLEDAGVGVGLHYPVPVHRQKAYADLGYPDGSFPVAECLARDCLSLPIYAELSNESVDYVCAKINEYFNRG